MSFLAEFQGRIARTCAITLVLAAGACTTSSGIDDTFAVGPAVSAPTPLPAPANPGSATVAADSAAVIDKPVPPRSGQPVDTGSYPNINIVPEGQTAQLSNGETAALKAQLSAEKESQRLPGEPIEAYLARLKRLQQLGSTNAAAVLAEIEASK